MTITDLQRFTRVPWWRALAPLLPVKKISRAGDLYLSRYVLHEGEGVRVYLHEFHRPDFDDVTHDHPWPFFHQVLEGAYMEHHHPGDGSGILRPTGYSAVRDATFKHRIGEITHPCWTLVVVGERVREWGFDCKGGWIPWQEHARRGESCGDGVTI